jgi:DNA replication and repair protein RecF
MLINNIKIKNYRNFREADIQLNDVLNIFIGDNGQGKTNLLESVYLCSIGRTFRQNSENDLINFSENKSSIEISGIKNNCGFKMDLILERNKKKQVLVNGARLDKTSEMIGIINNVIFTPDDMKIVKGNPGERRKFINIDISQVKPKYKYLLNSYKKVITERNMILKNYCTKEENKDIISIWNDYLSNIGSELIWYRNEYIDKLKKYSVDIYSDLSGNKEKLEMRYSSNIGNIQDLDKINIKKLFSEKIENGFKNEVFRKTSLYGPHRDELIIEINGKECKYFGSQGQQRSAILAIKLAEIEIIREEVGEYPVLLLDDVLSELDNKRKGYLIDYIKNIQTIITTTDDNDLKNLTKNFNKKNFYINEGKIGNITN